MRHVKRRVIRPSVRAESEVTELLAALGAVDGMYVEWRTVQRTGVNRYQKSYTSIDERTQIFDDERVRVEILSAELTITQPSEVAA